MRVNITTPITWLHDALLAAHPTVPWRVEGVDRQWAEVTVEGGSFPAGLNLASFAATVRKPLPRRELGNTAVGTNADYGSGRGVLALRNVAVPPLTNPVGGGTLYAQDGALYWRGSNGTLTKIADA